ncbi:Uncharacterised protein [Legionella busanensis]|uniref:Uncharacterized protein n=1 Tax=Legionella busanensis TaxID=190655 RepID=A0A378JPK9_9GAMM|nr:hypothetical protein [Legionella busanensis]STX52129.1 Uncharacterised protein [Legionella busanensis]
MVNQEPVINTRTSKNNQKKQGSIISNQLQSNERESANLELTTQPIEKQRVWLLSRTDQVYKGPVDTSLLHNVVKVNGVAVKGQLRDTKGEWVTLEAITKAKQWQRQRVWVYSGTGIKYLFPIEENALQNITRKKGVIVSGQLLNSENQLINLECITRTAQGQSAENDLLSAIDDFDTHQVESSELEHSIRREEVDFNAMEMYDYFKDPTNFLSNIPSPASVESEPISKTPTSTSPPNTFVSSHYTLGFFQASQSSTDDKFEESPVNKKMKYRYR